MNDWISHWPVWELIRLSGFISYILLLAGICLGILYSFPFWSGRAKLGMFRYHRLSTITGTGIAMLHGVLPVISTYMPFAWREVLIPFTAANHRIWNGLGTLATYTLLVLIFTSDIRQKLGRKLWILTHMLSYPMFVAVWIHSYFIGTDTAVVGMRWMYLLSLVLIGVLTIARGFVRKPAGKSRKDHHTVALR